MHQSIISGLTPLKGVFLCVEVLRLLPRPQPYSLSRSSGSRITISTQSFNEPQLPGKEKTLATTVVMHTHTWCPLKAQMTAELKTHFDTPLGSYWSPYLSYFLTPVSQGGLLKFLEVIKVNSNTIAYLMLTLQISTSYPNST